MMIRGFPLIKRGDIWVGVFGEDHAVHIRYTGRGWSAFEPCSNRSYAHGKTLKECGIAALSHYENQQQQRAARLKERLNATTRQHP
jgi:hypothetical protein